ncbi:MAG TPA: integrin alpha, partial [Flavobacteriales bacterium]|nr:integrin alpha [Flavobacteriales bacterium]
ATGKVSSSNEIRSGTTNFATLGADHNLGWGIAPAGDFDNDGVEDVFIGAPGNDDGGTDRGAVYLTYLNTSGTVKGYTKIANGANLTLANTDRFGVDIDTIGDLDNNGVVDIVVGAYQNDDGGTNRGAAYVVFLKSDGTVKKSQRISNTQGNFGETFGGTDLFGIGVAGIGDFDGDGKEDIAVGSNMNSTGAVHIITLDTSGNCVTFKKINNSGSNFPYTLTNGKSFGFTVEMIPDIDGNGINDLVIGQGLAEMFGIARGRFWITMLDSAGNVLEARELSDSCGLFYSNTNDQYTFGQCFEYMGLDAFGNIRVAFGGRDDYQGTDRGSVFTAKLYSFKSKHMPANVKERVVLKRELDAGYYYANQTYLAFEFDEEYHDSDSKLNYSVYDKNRNVVLTSANVSDPVIVNRIGDNRRILPLTGLPTGFYTFEVKNQNNEVFKLRFRK